MFVSCAKKEDADINKIVSDAYPNVSIESLKKIDENFHEIIINNQSKWSELKNTSIETLKRMLRAG